MQRDGPAFLGASRRAARRVGARVRGRWRSALFRALRITTAAVTAYVTAAAVGTGADPLLAPLTALLVVQVTLSSTFRSTWQRIVSVISGVLIAVGFSSVVGLTWWSLGIMIAASIVVGQLLRLGGQLLEVPISAMLVLAVGGAEAAAWGRIGETLIGATVGVLVNTLVPPPVQQRSAGEAVERFGEEIAALLERAADRLTSPDGVDDVGQWLDDARRVSRHVNRVDTALREGEESRRYNVRALGTPDPFPGLRRAVEVLEHSSVAVRGLFRAISDGVRAQPDVVDEEDSDIRLALVVLLREVAGAVRQYALMARREAEPLADVDAREVSESLQHLREARARLTDLLLVDSGDRVRWELGSTLLQMVERVLRELDIDEHQRARRRYAEDAGDPGLPAVTAQRLREGTRLLSVRRGPDSPGQ